MEVSSLEPPTTAKAILHSSKGPIEIELWAKECPLASRNFLQLCLDGYYDGCKFHRVVRDFIVQSGDPSGTGYGGSAIYENGDFADEFHSRLKFNRRGLVGCANTGEKDTNGSQFIITLAPAPDLNGKNTLFGRVVGETFYNVLTIGEAEIEEDDRPLYPAKITSTEVIVPYFPDLRKDRGHDARNQQSYDLSMKKDKKRKPQVKLSYNDDEEDEDEGIQLAPKIKKSKKLPNTITNAATNEIRSPQKTQQTKKDAAPNNNLREQQYDDDNDLLKKISNTTSEHGTTAPLSSINEQISAMKDNIKNKTNRDNIADESAKKSLSPLEEMRQQYNTKKAAKSKDKKKSKSDREKATLSMLQNFRSKLSGVKEENTGNINDNDETELNSEDELPSDYEETVDNSLDFMGHKFQEDEKKPRNPDDDLLITLDPLEEKQLKNEKYSKQEPKGGKKR